ncbi:MAG: phosphatidate cytidylyltransferase [Rhodospirillaceae bacterium]|nr:phosphatidate cytidylyltransferase [Rhodospirillaceae bacterium]
MNRLSNLQARIATAFVIGPLAIAAAWLHHGTWVALIAVAVVAGGREWARMMVPHAALPLTLRLGAGLAATAVVASLFGVPWGLGVLVAAVALAWLPWPVAGEAALVGPLAWGLLYLGPSAVALVWLHAQPGIGLTLVIWVLVVVWTTDIGAYASGRSIGGPRLWPAVSPRKTWAGFVGGLVLGSLGGLAVRRLAVGDLSPSVVAVAVAVSLASQAGDLLESGIKRRHGVKDTGGLLPGHGGVLDRLDGLFVAAPVFAMIHAMAGDDLRWQ